MTYSQILQNIREQRRERAHHAVFVRLLVNERRAQRGCGHV
jgi:hypothetical protein